MGESGERGTKGKRSVFAYNTMMPVVIVPRGFLRTRKNSLIAPSFGRRSKRKNPEARRTWDEAREKGSGLRLVVWQSDFYSQRVAVTESGPRRGDGRRARWKDKQMDKCECVQERN